MLAASSMAIRAVVPNCLWSHFLAPSEAFLSPQNRTEVCSNRPQPPLLNFFNKKGSHFISPQTTKQDFLPRSALFFYMYVPSYAQRWETISLIVIEIEFTHI